MCPPPNLRAKTEKWKGYSIQERDRTLHYLEHDPDSLQESLRKWLLALFEEGPRSMKRVNLLLYSLRAIKIQEFVKLNEDPRTLLQAVVICCGKYPNPQIKQEEEEKCLLKRMQQQQQSRPQTSETEGRAPPETAESTSR